MSRTRVECLAAADALDAAAHLMDDDEDAQALARLADQWRAEAGGAPESEPDGDALAAYREAESLREEIARLRAEQYTPTAHERTA